MSNGVEQSLIIKHSLQQSSIQQCWMMLSPLDRGLKCGNQADGIKQIYSRSSPKRPPREFRKVVTTRAGRLRELALACDHVYNKQYRAVVLSLTRTLNKGKDQAVIQKSRRGRLQELSIIEFQEAIQTGFHNAGRKYRWSLTKVFARRALVALHALFFSDASQLSGRNPKSWKGGNPRRQPF